MDPNRSVRAIAGQWQREFDSGLEMGEPAVLDLGAAASVQAGMPGALAIDWLDGERQDVAGPVVVAGGTSAAWLLSLVHQRPDDVPDRSLAAVTAYSAPDPATHQAALTIWDARRSPFRQRPAELPPAMQSIFAPPTQPGAPVAWESLPFQEAAARDQLYDGWTAWAAVVIAVALILIALLA